MTKTASVIAAIGLAAGLAALPAPATAQADNVNEIIVYGSDPCPRSTDDEVVVCARKPESERYRIPEEFRGEGQRQSQSWAERAESLEYVGDTGIQSCSTVGPGGFTGCWAEMMRQAREERRRNPQPRRQ